jgi:hypothetical protein
LRLDSGNDAIEDIVVVEAHNEQDEKAAAVHYLIKMHLAARMIYTGRRIKLAFGFGCPVVPIFRRLYVQLAGT